MHENASESSCLSNSKSNLQQMRREEWLSQADAAAVDRAIAALDMLIAETQLQ